MSLNSSYEQVLSVSVVKRGEDFAVNVEVPEGDPDPDMIVEACWLASTTLGGMIGHYGQLAAIRVHRGEGE